MQRALSLLTLLLALGAPVGAETYFVTPEGTGDFPTIQAALDAAQNGDVVELGEGVFRGDGNRDLGFGGKALTLRSRGDDAERCILDCEGSFTAPHRGLRFAPMDTALVQIRGVTVLHGSSSDC